MADGIIGDARNSTNTISNLENKVVSILQNGAIVYISNELI